MQVILREDVEKVGLRGEVVDVAAGYARNYLLPRRLAEPASAGRVAELERTATSRARHEAQSFEQAQELAQKLEGAGLRFDVQAGETGTLFGSVTATDIAEKVWAEQKVRIDRRKLELPESIKRIGRYEIPVELFTDVTATLRVAVVPEGGELPPEEELAAMDEAAAREEAAAEAEAEAAREAEAAATDVAVAEAEAEEEVPEEQASEEQAPMASAAAEAPADESAGQV
jgi:large subunit ribosomal protein L9